MSEIQVPDEIYVVVATEVSSQDPMLGISEVIGRLQPTKVKLAELAGNVKLFMQQMEQLLSHVPTGLGEFEFSEFEVSAGITAGGQLTLYGITQAEAGVEGGLKFVFKKRSVES